MKRLFIVVALCVVADTGLIAQTGEQIFASSCAPCHNLDGRGGGHAPNISGGSPAQSYSDERVAGIIHNGIPTLGMPAFGSLSQDQVTAVIRHLRKLQETGGPSAKVGGDVRAGRALFFGKARCSQCHMAERTGGFIASDLGATNLKAETIRQAILQPPATPDDRVTTVSLKTRVKISGLIRNQDNFSLQLQDTNGTLYFLNKADIEKLETATQTFMPANYDQSLSPSEVQNLVDYLSSLTVSR